MRASPLRLRALLSIGALVCLIPAVRAQAVPPQKEKAPGAGKAAAKVDPAAVRKLIEQLDARDFKAREKAMRALAALDEVPDALREAARSAKPEVRQRARQALARLTARLEERAFQAMLADLDKLGLDRFIRRMVTDKRFAGEKQWQLLQTVTRAVTKKAREMGGQRLPVPEFDFKLLPLADVSREQVAVGKRRVLLRGAEPGFTGLDDCVILCTGRTPPVTGLTNCVLLVDGDFMGATCVDNSLLIVRGNVGCVTSVRHSIILATGNFVGATRCDDSFLQVNNQRIRFTGARSSVLVNTALRTTDQTNCHVLKTDKGPLQLLHFCKRETDAQLAWGEEVNGLAMAITPADQPYKFLVRWKNVGKGLLEMPWVRFKANLIDPHADDLWGHVFLKGPGGKLARARPRPERQPGSVPLFLYNIVLGPRQTHEEVIDLWAYVERPAAGRYQLWIDLDVPPGRRLMEWEAKAWAGKIRSNTLQIDVGG